jgi:hypothetical protein
MSRSGLLAAVILLTALLGYGAPTRGALPVTARLDPVHRPSAAPAFVPCSPVAKRTIDPLIAPEETDLNVRVRLEFNCPTDARKLNLFILQNGESVGSAPGEMTLNVNLMEALRSFITSIDRTTGSRGGYLLFAQDAATQIPLSSFSTWPQSYGGWVTSALPTGGMLKAMRDAAAQLPADPDADGAENILLIVLAGAQTIGTPAEREQACEAVAAAHARVAAISMQAPSNAGTLHDFPCIDWLVRSAEVDGSDLGRAFDDMRDIILRPPTVESIEVYDGLTDDFDYVRGSGRPRDPDTLFAGEMTWSLASPTPGEQVISYRVHGNPGKSDILTTVSRDARATFEYADGSRADLVLDNPVVCLHQRRTTRFCDRMTARAPVYLPMARRGTGG